ncbi:Cell cycle checkpoint protein rad17 [Apophysomyces ossiformis]|uniref:Cell cycle checkpoint protein rad17 n=1 Tax=Apophysomyces ossiformis TaxID=679940 RepID=A0A8H7ETI9_9FUNG|nr:Cell cycle checkpoint protein rad17 [Apophysomyces ossiformis]
MAWPAGSGKSAVIRTLAKVGDYELVEWTNAVRDDSGDSSYESNMSKFEDFLLRSTRMPTFTIDSEGPRKKIILLDDLPDITTNDTKSHFQTLLKSCLTDDFSIPFLIVLVSTDVSTETGLSRNRGREVFVSSIYDIIPREVLCSPECGWVEFNPATKAKIVKMLRHIASIESTRPGKARLSADRISAIADSSHGDIRCAINTLQFELFDPGLRVPQKRKRESSVNTRKPGWAFGVTARVECNIFLPYLHENCLKFCDNIRDYTQFLENLGVGDHIASIGNWQDDVRLEYQSLISMRGIMCTEPMPASGKMIELNKPAFWCSQKFSDEHVHDTESVTSSIVDIQRKVTDRISLTADELRTLSTVTVPFALPTIIETHPTTTGRQEAWEDAIDEFSDDEFDKVFGDGSDLADLPW